MLRFNCFTIIKGKMCEMIILDILYGFFTFYHFDIDTSDYLLILLKIELD